MNAASIEAADAQDAVNGRKIAASLKELDDVLKTIKRCDRLNGIQPVNFEIFSAFPYYEEMKKAWNKPGNAAHIQNTVYFMNQILAVPKHEDDDDVLKEILPLDNARRRTVLLDFIKAALDKFGEDEQTVHAFFRVAAFYHDIGKYINRERHPTIGWYIVQNLQPAQRRALETILDERDYNGNERKRRGDLSYFRLLVVMLRDHDQFGVLSTGEASYPILLNSVTFSDNAKDKIKIITALMLLNLADIAATLKHLPWSVINNLREDYKWFTDNLKVYRDLQGSKDGGVDSDADSAEPLPNVRLESFDNFVIRVSSQEDRVCKRIHRILMTAVRDLTGLDKAQLLEKANRGVRDWFLDVYDALHENEAVRRELEALNDIQLVRDAYHTVFSSDTSRREFASVFTHICKLDYGKRFFNRLIGYWVIETLHKQVNGQARDSQAINAVYRLFAVLRRLTGTYEAMIFASGSQTGSLIGVEMKDLAPDEAPEKPETIAQLIAENHYPGLTWMMSDTPAWYF